MKWVPKIIFFFHCHKSNLKRLREKQKLKQSHLWMCIKLNIWMKNVQLEQKVFGLYEMVIRYEHHTCASRVLYLNDVRCSMRPSHNVHRAQVLLFSFEHFGTFKTTVLFQSNWKNENAKITKLISLQWMLVDCYIEWK